MSRPPMCPQEYIRTEVSTKKVWEQEDPPNTETQIVDSFPIPRKTARDGSTKKTSC